MYARITKDLISMDELDRTGRVLLDRNTAMTVSSGPVIDNAVGTDPDGELLTVRLQDDDRETYYEAVADDDALEWLFAWAQADAGCTILQVNKDGAWEDVIS